MNRRAGVYTIVLAIAVLVTLLGVTGVTAARLRFNAAATEADLVQARLIAEAGVDKVADAISRDPNWRTNYTPGVWFNTIAVKPGTCTVTVIDTVDTTFGNRLYDPIKVTSVGKKGQATHTIEVTLTPVGTPLPGLKTCLYTAGQLHVESGNTVTTNSATLATNTALRNDGTIKGSVEYLTTTGSGSATGSSTVITSAKAFPPSGVLTMYQNLGTAISPGGAMNKKVLAPGYSPYGAANAEGVYVIATSGDTTISNCRINGTLVVLCSGHKVTISGSVFFAPARPDYPALIVDGDLYLQYDSSTPLSESANAANFNPAGAPYNGVTNATNTDSYPCEIDGLVHCRGQMQINANSLVRGAIICESNASSNAVRIQANTQITFDPSIYNNPPMGYTTAVTLKAGNWKQVVSP